MTTLFKSPKIPETKVDTTAADNAKADAEAEQKKINEELAAKRRAVRAGQTGRFSLLTSGSETGISDTLG
jgi:hypothetical protein